MWTSPNPTMPWTNTDFERNFMLCHLQCNAVLAIVWTKHFHFILPHFYKHVRYRAYAQRVTHLEHGRRFEVKNDTFTDNSVLPCWYVCVTLYVCVLFLKIHDSFSRHQSFFLCRRRTKTWCIRKDFNCYLVWNNLYCFVHNDWYIKFYLCQ